MSIVGPESSGKTSLAKWLSGRLQVPWLAEYAREYLSGRRDYDESNLEEIAQGQASREMDIIRKNPSLVILDTDLVVIAIWWQEMFRCVPRWVDDHLSSQPDRHYLLMRPDLEWEADPLRVSPNDRDRLFGLYKDFLQRKKFSMTEVSGQGEARTDQALAAVASLYKV